MRGLKKVAALLSSACVSAFVIPDSFGVRPAGGVIDYEPLEASLKFTIDDVKATFQHPIFKLRVSGVDKACGESSVEINGQRLETEWDGIEAHGRGYLDVYSEREAIWSITCLYDSTPSDGSFSNGDDVVHLLRLRFDQSEDGFTISYKQAGRPTIVRFSPNVVGSAGVSKIAGKWRKPSIEFDQDIPHPGSDNEDTASTNSLWHGPQSILSSVNAFKSHLTEKIGTAIKKLNFCPKHKARPLPPKSNPLAIVPYVPTGNETRSTSETLETQETPEADGTPQTPEDLETLETVQINESTETVDNHGHDELDENDSTVTSAGSGSTITLAYPSAAETRSLSSPGELTYSTAANSPSPSTSAPHSDADYKPLKIFGLTLILLSLLAWCILRWKDPRWRVDRAARLEERRTKRLYKRAARQHKIKTWFWKFRMRFKLASNETLSWDEKRARVSGQEEALENVMKNDIRALRNAHRVVSNITAAEEGRNQFEYEASSSERRRSVSTLPGYESEGGRPPSYEASGSFEGTTLVGGTSFTPADIDSNPDSSVVSTSPRISRDGTNSDFDEKIETLSLDQNPVIENHRVYNRV